MVSPKKVIVRLPVAIVFKPPYGDASFIEISGSHLVSTGIPQFFLADSSDKIYHLNYQIIPMKIKDLMRERKKRSEAARLDG
jgi:hypothetical protein